ncbi:malate dehydrogenase (oxaloacetate-decarboxylating) [Pseudoxanthobacter soli DSM 19599]|uniref:Malate dehydrogenase (Oxaloacetate-decarboxylating) n=1 Tax=Pseudoxanthobacter soli DSM 19599 TaxID=1123029 RepID=A0A1M7ZD49_9HYPH|nr:NAD-dependent malic enzyme [Pseudoxanthobacter soli]SHO62851.1 malate dehydrogenase (oxaloacetate-decarboxylating) [Pseudoxanthobacter soli DSM 19599]
MTTKKIDATRFHGQELIDTPLLNKADAFSDSERTTFRLHGLLPPSVETIETQLERVKDAYQQKTTDLERHIYLRALQDTNETLFYRFMVENVTDLMPMVYTPVVGLGCQKFSEIYRRPRGLFISYPLRDSIDTILEAVSDQDVRVIVVTDGERILGLGDQGTGGMGIPIGKLSLYTACGGIAPEYTLPITLDVGTNNQERLDDPLYIGWRNRRITGDEYVAFVDAFVAAVKRKWPNVLLQFEDFAQNHATMFLERYRDQLCMFNDDVQGTASVVVGTVLSAVKVSGRPLSDQRVVVVGAGSAGCGIAEQMIQLMVEDGVDPKEARSRFYMIDREGLVLDTQQGLWPFQAKLAHTAADLAAWPAGAVPGKFSFLETVKNAKPTILIGVTGQPDIFTQEIIRTMAATVERPIVFPLSNPTNRCEAQPADVLAWTNGRAIIGTGSPFQPVPHDGKLYPIAQTNNAYIFPGLGLGILALGIPRVSDGMFMAASRALADANTGGDGSVPVLLPPLSDIRAVSRAIAIAVAKAAIKDGLVAAADDDTIAAKVDATMWNPEYRDYVAA